MHIASWSTIVTTAVIAVSIGPPHAHALDVQASVGIPRVSPAIAGAPLTRRVIVAVDSEWFSADASMPVCARTLAVASTDTIDATPGCAFGAAAGSSWLGEHTAGVTLKLPQLTRDMPYIDLSLRTWGGDMLRDESRTATTGVAAEAEITYAIGPYELSAGYSQPLRGADASRVAWIGAAVRFAGHAMIHLGYESAYEPLAGVHDSRYALRFTRAVGDAMRATAYLSHAPNDSEGRWQAGVGVAWTF